MTPSAPPLGLADPATASHESPILVLDTNVVLDWLVFADASSRPLAEAIASGRCRWCATRAMRDELADVLGRGTLAAWRPDAQAVFATWDRCARLVEPGPAMLHGPLRCTDPDDQKFIDLALALGARALLSRDRAVLKLARPARARGLRICTTVDWSASP